MILHEVQPLDLDIPSQRGLISRTPRPLGVRGRLLEEKHVSVPGLTRKYELDNLHPYRYYRLKILAAEGYQKKVKIADFGLRDGNKSYAGFIVLRHSTKNARRN